MDRINLTPSLAGSLVPRRHGTFGAFGVNGDHRRRHDPHNSSEIGRRNAPIAESSIVAPCHTIIAKGGVGPA